MKLKQFWIAAAAGAGALALPAGPAAAEINPFVGEIRAVGMSWCPNGWMPLDGQTLLITSYTPLFALIGTTYGGNGRSDFGLPDMRGASLYGHGTPPGEQPIPIGDRGGAQSLQLSGDNLPAHAHGVSASARDPERNSPGGSALPTIPGTTQNFYTNAPLNTAVMHPDVISRAGGGRPIPLYQPFQAINYCIAVHGTYPPRPPQ